MMICQQCGKKNDPDAVFCVECSHPLSQSCPNCATQNAGDARFCKKCGEALDEVTASAQSTRLKALRESASASLQEKLRLAETEIEGQRKPVTILFADIAGSTAIAEKLDPEEWKEVVQGAHHRVSEAIHRYEGTIAQLLGDGVLAFFGAPLTHEDDPERAVRAALNLQESLQEYRVALAGFVDAFHMRVGIHTGEVVVGPVGAEGHIEYLAIGDAVNIAARMEQAAQPDQVLISQACARFVEHAFDLGDFEPIQAKGKAEPVHAAIVLGLKASPDLARGIGGVRTPFVGRTTELAQMQDALKALCQSQGGIITLVGEAGIGKSRLLEEVREMTCKRDQKNGEGHFDPQTIRWLEGRALSYGGSLSFWIIRQLLLTDLGLSDGASQVKIKAALRSRINDLYGEKQGEAVLPYLAHLMDIKLVDQEAAPIKNMDGEAIKYQALIYLAEYFEHAASDRPTVLIFEDLHWADPSSLEALGKLAPLADQVPLLFVLLMRIEREHDSWVLKNALKDSFPHRTTEIELHRLGEQESQLLVEQLLRPEIIPENVRQLILTRSEGNPFYLEEVVRHLLESGLVVEKDGEWVASEGLAEIGVPETLQGVLLARIDRLEEDVRDTLQMAAVIGKSFLYKLLDAISDAEQALETHLSQLQRMDLVREKARLPELEYIFKHSLTQEAAYNSLLLERRKAFHRKVGEALEGLFPDRQEEFLGLLAHHFQFAGDTEKAADYLIRAGDRARLADAYEEAIDLYRDALPLLDALDDMRRARQLWLDVGLSFHILSKFPQSKEAYQNAHRISRELQRIRSRSPGIHKGRKDATQSLRILIDSFYMKTFDPGKKTFNPEITANCFSALTRKVDMWSVEPQLAWSWDISDDGKRYVFHLRDDAYWTDGKPVTADQFVWSWLRNISPEEDCHYAWMFDDVIGAMEFRTGLVDNPETVGVRALDPLTLEVQLISPANYFLYIVAMPIAFPLPLWKIQEHGDDWWKPEFIVSNGPFRLNQFDEQGIVIERDQNYFNPTEGNLEQVVGILVDETNGKLNREKAYEAFKNNEIDICEYNLQDPPAGIPKDKCLAFSSRATLYLFLNPSHQPLDKKLVRQAIAAAINTSAFPLEDTCPATGGLVHPGMPGHSPGINSKKDTEGAIKALKDAGWQGGDTTLQFKFGVIGGDEHQRCAHTIASQLSETLGIQSIVHPIEPTDDVHDFHCILAGWYPDYPDMDSTLRRSSINYLCIRANYKRQEYETLLAAAGNTLDRSERLTRYRKLDHWLVAEEFIFVPISYSEDSFAITQSNIRNFPLTHSSFEDVIIED